jgi:hypothetical protein
MDRGPYDDSQDFISSSDESDKVAPKDFMRSLPDSGKRTRVMTCFFQTSASFQTF